MFGRRPDATLVTELSPMRRFMQFVSPRRNDSLVYFAQEVDVENALAFVAAKNEDRPRELQFTLFHLVLFSLARIFHERPRLNRFTQGGRVWQRDGVHLSFSAKMRFDDDAPVITLKRRIDPTGGLEAMVDTLHASLKRGRSGARSTSDKEMDWLLRLPPIAVKLLVGLAHRADALGLLPRAMIEADPLFCSAFIANLGSVGLDAGYHHLWEHGNCPVFCVIGQIHEGPDGRRRITLKYTYDERVEDGLYCARSLEKIREWIEKPELLSP